MKNKTIKMTMEYSVGDIVIYCSDCGAEIPYEGNDSTKVTAGGELIYEGPSICEQCATKRYYIHTLEIIDHTRMSMH